MRILVAIANHGEKNRHHCEHLIETYSQMSHDVEIVILSDKAKTFASSNVHVEVGAPTSDPWSLPFAHRKLFANRRDEFDLFIYSEDDTEILERHIELFVAASKELPEDKILGFLRYERDSDGQLHYCSVHHAYRWLAESTIRAGRRTYARYTNDHAAAFMLTRQHLDICIASGGFLIEPHSRRYDMLVSAATDPYTQCGLEKLICISDFQSSCLHHLPNVYIGKIGVPQADFDVQVEKLLTLHDQETTHGPLTEVAARIEDYDRKWDKRYYEPLNPEIVSTLDGGPRTVLSVGCERGATEAALVQQGHTVTAVPLDEIIAETARLRGIEILPPDVDQAISALQDRSFDVLLFNHILPYFEDPVQIIKRFCEHLKPGGLLIASFDNMQHYTVLQRRLRGGHGLPAQNGKGDYDATGVHGITAARLQGWLHDAGLTTEPPKYALSSKTRLVSRLTLGMTNSLMARSAVLTARKPGNAIETPADVRSGTASTVHSL